MQHDFNWPKLLLKWCLKFSQHRWVTFLTFLCSTNSIFNYTSTFPCNLDTCMVALSMMLFDVTVPNHEVI